MLESAQRKIALVDLGPCVWLLFLYLKHHLMSRLDLPLARLNPLARYWACKMQRAFYPTYEGRPLDDRLEYPSDCSYITTGAYVRTKKCIYIYMHVNVVSSITYVERTIITTIQAHHVAFCSPYLLPNGADSGKCFYMVRRCRLLYRSSNDQRSSPGIFHCGNP